MIRDGEVVEVVARRGPRRFDVFDLRRARPVVQRAREFVERRARPLGDDGDGAVRVVADEADEAEALRRASCEVAKPDALHASTHGGFEPLQCVGRGRHGRGWVNAEKYEPSGGVPGRLENRIVKTVRAACGFSPSPRTPRRAARTIRARRGWAA